MSDENTDQELDEEMRQLMEKESEAKAAVQVAEPEPQPEPAAEPEPTAQAQVEEPVQEPVAQTPDTEKPVANDPLEWAKKKGLTSPEAIARSLQSMEDEFHRRNQAGHPGYRDLQNGNPAPAPTPPPNWGPRPDTNGYGYPPPPPPSRGDVTQNLARKYGMDPEDVERLMPMVVDAAEAIATRRTAHLEREVMSVRRESERSAEFNRLMQDPHFVDPRVQSEMREVLKDGQLFQRGGQAYTTAFQMALANLARKQLQQGGIPDTRTPSNNPPVTAGGGNGSASSGPVQINEKVFGSWTEAEQKAFLESNGRKVPKR